MWAVALTAIFAFRLLFGLSREFFFEDETQIFLMGLRYFATGAWPYFGADVVWTDSEIPGALQALLVGVPLHVAPIPEAPYVLLNLLSMAAIAAFAWYIKARLPTLPTWLVWGWLMMLPWTLELSTHLINPSYVLAASIAFFIGFFEAVPVFRLGKISLPVAFGLMGAATAWIIQIHMSWPLLLPYAGLAWVAGWRVGTRRMAINAVSFVGGFLVFGVLLIPTVRRVRPARRKRGHAQESAAPPGQSLDCRHDAGADFFVCEPGNLALHRGRRGQALDAVC